MVEFKLKGKKINKSYIKELTKFFVDKHLFLVEQNNEEFKFEIRFKDKTYTYYEKPSDINGRKYQSYKIQNILCLYLDLGNNIDESFLFTFKDHFKKEVLSGFKKEEPNYKEEDDSFIRLYLGMIVEMKMMIARELWNKNINSKIKSTVEKMLGKSGVVENVATNSESALCLYFLEKEGFLIKPSKENKENIDLIYKDNISEEMLNSLKEANYIVTEKCTLWCINTKTDEIGHFIDNRAENLFTEELLS